MTVMLYSSNYPQFYNMKLVWRSYKAQYLEILLEAGCEDQKLHTQQGRKKTTKKKRSYNKNKHVY